MKDPMHPKHFSDDLKRHIVNLYNAGKSKREIRRRARIVGTLPDGDSALMLVTARLKYIADARVGQEEVPGHVQTGGDGQTEGKDGGLVEDGAEDG